MDAENLAAGASANYPTADFAVIRAQGRLAGGDREGAVAALREAAARAASTPRSGIALYVASRHAALAGDRVRADALLAEAAARGLDLTWWVPREIVACRSAGLNDLAADLEDRLRGAGGV